MISCRQKSEDLRQRAKLVVYWVGRPRWGGEATREWQGIQTISVMILARQAIQHASKVEICGNLFPTHSAAVVIISDGLLAS